MTNQPMTNDSKQPPVFSSWEGWYGLVIAVFALVVMLMWWFSRAFL